MTDKQVPCEVFSRVVGYLRPIGGWNPGKVKEYEDRVNYDIGDKPAEPKPKESK